MTGAPMPAGADAVVMIEYTQMLEDNRVQVNDKPPKPGQNVLVRGREIRARGHGLATRNGPSASGVWRPGHGRPHCRFAFIRGRRSRCFLPAMKWSSHRRRPGPGQIRNGNGTMLVAQVHRAGGCPRSLGIARDRPESLRPLVAEGLRSSVLVLSGGVSAGKLDLVPAFFKSSASRPISTKWR